MTKLLTEQELRFTLCMKLGYDDGVKGRQEVMVLESDVKDIVELVQSQKHLYAEMVVGEKKNIPSGPHSTYPSSWIDINNHIAEQRARIK